MLAPLSAATLTGAALAVVPASMLAPLSAATLTGALTPMATASRTDASVLTRATESTLTSAPSAMLETTVAGVPADELGASAAVLAPMSAATLTGAPAYER